MGAYLIGGGIGVRLHSVMIEGVRLGGIVSYNN